MSSTVSSLPYHPEPIVEATTFYNDPAKGAGDLVAHCDADGANNALVADNGSGIAGTCTCSAVGGDVTDIYIVTPMVYFLGDYGAMEIVFRPSSNMSGAIHRLFGLSGKIGAGAALTEYIHQVYVNTALSRYRLQLGNGAFGMATLLTIGSYAWDTWQTGRSSSATILT